MVANTLVSLTLEQESSDYMVANKLVSLTLEQKSSDYMVANRLHGGQQTHFFNP